MNITKILKNVFFVLFFSCLLVGCQLRKKLNLEPMIFEKTESGILFRTLNGFILFNEFDYFENDGLQLSLFIDTNNNIDAIFLEKIILLDSLDNIICSNQINYKIELMEIDGKKMGYFSTLGNVTLQSIQNSMNVKNKKNLYFEIKNKKKIYVQFCLQIEEQYGKKSIVVPFLYSIN